MNNQKSTVLFNCKITNFIPPEDDNYESNKENLGSKKFSMMFGDKKIDWKLKIIIVYDGIKIYFKKEGPKFNDFNVRITCMIPRIIYDEDDESMVDTEGSMYTEHVAVHASTFCYEYEALYMKVENFFGFFGYEDDVLDMYIKMELMEGSFTKEPKTVLSDQIYPSAFADLYRSGDFSDFTIVCADGVKIPVHRSILYGNSSVLKAMMLADMKESIENNLEVPDINGDVMDKILMFMYTQKVDDISDHFEGILYGAEKYQIQNLKTLCIGYMFDKLCVGNAVEFFMLASLYGAERLKEVSLTYIQLHYDTLRSTEKLKQLNAGQLELIENAVKDYKSCELNFKFDMDPYSWGHTF